MGLPGTGKSTLAQALAKRHGYEYLDADDFHSPESRAQMAQGIPLTDEQRAPWVASIKRRLQSNAHQQIHATLAFSGLKKKHRDELRSAGLRTLVLYLNEQRETLEQRVSQRKGHFMAPMLLASQIASMENPCNEADVHPMPPGATLEQALATAGKIMAAYLV